MAVVVADIGGWMQTVGAQWLLVGQPNATVLVALVSTAAAVPFLILGIPAGVLGEFLNRRRILIAVQGFQVVVGSALAVLTVIGEMSPALLLTLTFLLGAGDVLQLPAYQALVQEIVPRTQLTRSTSLSAIGINISRAVGPALAGLAISTVGIGFVFALNVATSMFFLITVLRWRGYAPPTPHVEPFIDAARAGLRYVLYSGVVRNLFLRLSLFIIPANALWALLPFIASSRLHLGSDGYGFLLAALGLGSVSGALLLPLTRTRFSLNSTTAAGAALFGAGTIAATLSASLPLTLVVLFVTGVAWIDVVASFSAAVQIFLPTWVRSRGLSVYQIIFFGGAALGSALAGVVAEALGITLVNVVAGILLLVLASIQFLRPLPRFENIDQSTAIIPTIDQVIVDSELDFTDDATTLVISRWDVAPEQHALFIDHMRAVEASRRRTGARHWELYVDKDHRDSFVEIFDIGSWREHLEQDRSRLTEYDHQLLSAAAELASGPPELTQLISTDR
ncbi:MFS transporter [Subtercola boreus]|uniref:MFS transporter n=1 Tax=Subtercola boreus TaxID=120213 RepID=UPI00209C69A3|nr:MFS transporter [Subtercola boreus]